jgi:hypothetical protein
MAKYRITCNYSAGEAFAQGLVWSLLILVTFGAAAIFLPFFLLPAVLNRLEVEEVGKGL